MRYDFFYAKRDLYGLPCWLKPVWTSCFDTEGDESMAYARISMVEFNSPEEMETAEEDYQRIREETFPGIQMTINVRTGPQSLLSLGVYPDQETAQANLEGRKKAVEDPKWVKDTFYYEGDVSYWKID
tara:strand:- start:195 stop:578 length:384 start_codon:yes stop_codon:yes gene_type:complete